MARKGSQLNVIIAAGGTGGHLFPAQALACDLMNSGKEVKVAFLGANLSCNPYFNQPRFQSKDIASATFSKKWIFSIFRSLLLIQKGIMQALSFFRDFHPDVVIGFGSFYSLPTLMAAKFKRVPIILFESNVLPGRVNRFCSRWAKISAVQFFVSQLRLKGKTVCVKMPLLQKKKTITEGEARQYFGLKRDQLTLLIFGGSQGAHMINCLVCGAFDLLIKQGIDFQVIHMVGSKCREEKLRDIYSKYGILACVKSFERQMDLAWTAADLSISRAGASTLAEQIEFCVPGILIPFPHGKDNHQAINAAFAEEEIGGAVELLESACSSEQLASTILDLLADSHRKLLAMKGALISYKEKEKKDDLAKIVFDNV
jgi:UDP-N-acetylglucosamine--N-acetylmuramyl-(pentapeptide) pyrophosphoryl-undecaprenol N-acetylglucosamine transferase